MKSIILVIGVLSAVILNVNAETQFDLNKCHYEDSLCIVDTANTILATKLQGDSYFCVPDMNPFPVGDYDIHKSLTDDQITWSMFNSRLYGLDTMTIVDVTGFSKDVNGAYGISAIALDMYQIGNYTLIMVNNGRTIIGKGGCRLEITNSKFDFKFNGVGFTKDDGKEYLQIANFRFDLDVGHFNLYLDNVLVDGKDQTEGFNQILNANSDALWEKIKKPVLNEYLRVYRHLLQTVFNKTPYNELFLSD